MSLVSLGKYIPKYFILSIAMVNGIVSLISLSVFSLLVYRNARDFCVLILFYFFFSCTHHLQQSKIYFPATCKTEGREIQKFLANKGESPGAVVPIISSLKYLRWSFCFHYVER